MPLIQRPYNVMCPVGSRYLVKIDVTFVEVIILNQIDIT